MKNMFNIYYINNEKASEISMLFDKKKKKKITRIKNTEIVLAGETELSTDASSKIPFFGRFLPTVDLNGNLSRNRSNRVEDTVKVVSSKSTILRPLYDKAAEVRRLDENKIGNLIKIKGVNLSVVNSNDVIATKALLSGMLNHVPVEGMGFMNFTALLEAIFKDSAYVLWGKLPHKLGSDESLMLKIPMSAENEMESQYSITDIEIGKVTIIGIYRGKYERAEIERKINKLMALNDSKKQAETPSDSQDAGLDIEDGAIRDPNDTPDNHGKVHYIDVIAIIQDINL